MDFLFVQFHSTIKL